MFITLKKLLQKSEWLYWFFYFFSCFIEAYLLYLGHGHWLTNHVLSGLMLNAGTSLIEAMPQHHGNSEHSPSFIVRFWHRFHFKSPYYAGMSLLIYIGISITHTSQTWWLFTLFFNARHSFIPIFAINLMILYRSIWLEMTKATSLNQIPEGLNHSDGYVKPAAASKTSKSLDDQDAVQHPADCPRAGLLTPNDLF